MSQEERFDGVFMSVVQQAQGIENFFEALFGFMRRKTDLFTQEDVSRRMITSVMEKHLKMFSEDKERQAAIEKKKREEQAKKKAAEKAKEEQAKKKPPTEEL